MTRNRIFVIVLIDLALILAIGLYLIQLYHSNHNPNIHGIFIQRPNELTDFEFMDTHGNTFTKNQLKGHWSFLFFGFTNCEMVCPTTLSALNKAYGMLEKSLPSNLLPQVIFITVDPERDNINKIDKFVRSFNSHFLGARTDIGSTIALEKQLAISTQKLNNTINHSAEILLVNPAAQVQVYFPYPADPIQLANDYKEILKDHPN